MYETELMMAGRRIVEWIDNHPALSVKDRPAMIDEALRNFRPDKNARARVPQDLKSWPPGTKQEEVEIVIDRLCGCAGRWNCNCVACFNQVRGETWGAYNTERKERHGR